MIKYGSSTRVQPKTKFFNLATHWKMGFFYEIFVKFEYFLCCNCCIFILNVI